mmetsp:Transcript_99327/g.278136  ORF Transcript_99327/g.278136 Transcript_99327/m.278136 type:complete len:210 (+) Transcript_99327:1295-1924(+)
MIGFKPPLCRTRSRKFGQSPAMLPRAHTACSRTSSLGDWSSSTKRGSAPCSTTTRVCSAVPEAMFVSTQAASNCRLGLPISFSNCTKRGTMPAWMTSARGGSCSMERDLRKACVALNTASGSSDVRAWTKDGICAIMWALLGVVPISALPLAMDIELSKGDTPTGFASAPMRFFSNVSSLVCLRNWIAWSSRFLRASSASVAFLKPFWR